MSDAKNEYRETVWARKKESFFDSDIAKAIIGGMKRAQQYKSGWETVNLNDFVQKWVPDYITRVIKGKLYFESKDGKMAIITDLGGCYCRLADMTHGKPLYLDINGKDVRNYTDSHGKQHGRDPKERLRLTHFRIQKWKEMAKYLPSTYVDDLVLGGNK